MIKYTIDSARKENEINGEMYGLFFEDINQSADGGLNAEMVINGSFEFEYLSYDEFGGNAPPELRKNKGRYWEMSGCGSHEITENGGMYTTNPSYLLLKVGGLYKIENEGFAVGRHNRYGMAITKGEKYNFSLSIKNFSFNGKIRAYVKGEKGLLTSAAELEPSVSDSWQKYTAALAGIGTDFGRLVIEFIGNGRIGVDCVSLVPENVWGDADKYRTGKLSRRLVEALKGVNASFMRFPGGCVVEGDADFTNQYRWRNTVGPLEARKGTANLWGYYQSYGIGFYEFFALCEDLHMSPLPVLHVGLLCQIRTSNSGRGYVRYMPGTPEFQSEVIDNAADLIFFAKGDPGSPFAREAYWAKLRAEMGHEAPFELKYLGLGNENWGDEYFENFDALVNALRAYDYHSGQTDLLDLFGITVVTTCGIDSSSPESNQSWKKINEKYTDTIVDEHTYNTYQWFVDNTRKYDYYDRSGAKVFVGEYACHTYADGRGRLNGESTLRSALAEAAFLTGCERNADVVRMTAYAPLFASTENCHWVPDLIWFNPRDVMLTPNYFVQQMFATYTGTHTIGGIEKFNSSMGGGITIGGVLTSFAFSEVRILSAKNGAPLYKHNFKNGLGDWKVYPRSIGGKLEGGRLITEASEGFNGYYLEGNFCDVVVEVDFERLGGGQSLIVAVGVNGTKDAGTNDCDAFSLSCHYGKNRHGYHTAFEKRFDYMRTASEIMGGFYGYTKGGNMLRLRYTKEKLSAEIFVNGWKRLFEKNVWKVNEKVFASASAGGGNTYLKVVNLSQSRRQLSVELKNMIPKKRVKVITLAGDPNDRNEIGATEGVKYNVVPTQTSASIENNELNYTLEKNSFTVFVIEDK